MSDQYPAFRRELDAVLQRRDPQALRDFLVASGQWAPETTMDPEAAMWMMIAASPALAGMYGEADAWLKAHGRAEEGAAIAARRKGRKELRRRQNGATTEQEAEGDS